MVENKSRQSDRRNHHHLLPATICPLPPCSISFGNQGLPRINPSYLNSHDRSVPRSQLVVPPLSTPPPLIIYIYTHKPLGQVRYPIRLSPLASSKEQRPGIRQDHIDYTISPSHRIKITSVYRTSSSYSTRCELGSYKRTTTSFLETA